MKVTINFSPGEIPQLVEDTIELLAKRANFLEAVANYAKAVKEGRIMSR